MKVMNHVVTMPLLDIAGDIFEPEVQYFIIYHKILPVYMHLNIMHELYRGNGKLTLELLLRTGLP